MANYLVLFLTSCGPSGLLTVFVMLFYSIGCFPALPLLSWNANPPLDGVSEVALCFLSILLHDF